MLGGTTHTVKIKSLIAVGVVMVLASVACLGYFAGQTQVAIKWSWVPKEHNMLLGSMERIEVLLSQGDTSTVIRAVGAYNKTIRAMTNEFDFYRAADTLFRHTSQK
jgi:hypothetical protein